MYGIPGEDSWVMVFLHVSKSELLLIIYKKIFLNKLFKHKIIFWQVGQGIHKTLSGGIVPKEFLPGELGD